MKYVSIIFLAGLFLLPSLQAAAAGAVTGISCKQQIIEIGDLAIDVLDLCGEPDLKESYPVDGSHDCRYEQQWGYRFQRGARMTILTFRNGRLAEVELGSR